MAIDPLTTQWFGKRGEFGPDPFVYQVSDELHGKIAHLLRELFHSPGGSHGSNHDHRAQQIESAICKALGLPRLPHSPVFGEPFVDFVYAASDPTTFIRAVEIVLNQFEPMFDLPIDVDTSGSTLGHRIISSRLERLNVIFRIHACGYQAELTDGVPRVQMIRTDSEFLHVETVKFPLSLLRESDLAMPARQFEEAVIEWGRGNYADAITDANSAFEAVMKFVLGQEGTASTLSKS